MQEKDGTRRHSKRKAFHGCCKIRGLSWYRSHCRLLHGNVECHQAETISGVSEVKKDTHHKKMSAAPSQSSTETSDGPKNAGIGLKLHALSNDHILAGRFKVESIESSSPLNEHSVEYDDILMKINGEEVCGWELSKIMDHLKVIFLSTHAIFLLIDLLMQGAEGSSVSLEFYRAMGSGYLKLDFSVRLRA